MKLSAMIVESRQLLRMKRTVGWTSARMHRGLRMIQTFALRVVVVVSGISFTFSEKALE